MNKKQTTLSLGNANFRAISLQSGSNGNCIYVEAGDTKLIFDAGISGVQAQTRLARHRLQIQNVDALFISHDHSDHTRCAGIFHRKFGHALYLSQKTYVALQQTNRLGKLRDVSLFKSGDTIKLGDVYIHTVPTPHDGVDGVGFVVEYNNKQLGILTDLGHPFKGLKELVCGLDGVFLESNFDVEMLENGPYPYPLKQRISNPSGHISNEECAVLLKAAFKNKLQWAVLAHLSGENNSPKVALATNRKIVGKNKAIFVADRHDVSDIFTLE